VKRSFFIHSITAAVGALLGYSLLQPFLGGSRGHVEAAPQTRQLGPYQNLVERQRDIIDHIIRSPRAGLRRMESLSHALSSRDAITAVLDGCSKSPIAAMEALLQIEDDATRERLISELLEYYLETDVKSAVKVAQMMPRHLFASKQKFLEGKLSSLGEAGLKLALEMDRQGPGLPIGVVRSIGFRDPVGAIRLLSEYRSQLPPDLLLPMFDMVCRNSPFKSAQELQSFVAMFDESERPRIHDAIAKHVGYDSVLAKSFFIASEQMSEPMRSIAQEQMMDSLVKAPTNEISNYLGRIVNPSIQRNAARLMVESTTSKNLSGLSKSIVTLDNEFIRAEAALTLAKRITTLPIEESKQFLSEIGKDDSLRAVFLPALGQSIEKLEDFPRRQELQALLDVLK
jgi:hypothetical protein